MPSKQQQRQQQRSQRASLSQQFGALSLDKGPPPSTAHLAPPEDFSTFGGSSPGSSVVGTPQARSESPDLALLGTSLPPPPPPPPEPELQASFNSPSMRSTIGQKTFNGTAEMPEWMANVTGGFAKEISVLMQEMDDLRKEKQRLQMDVSNLMRTLSEYSPGGQFAPNQWPHPHASIPPDHPAPDHLDAGIPSEVEGQLVPRGPAKPGWKSIKPEPVNKKVIQSRVVPSPHQLSVLQSGQRSNSNTSLNTMAASASNLPLPPQTLQITSAPYQHPRGLPTTSLPPTPTHAMMHSQTQSHSVQHPPPHYSASQVQVPATKGPSWTNWRPGNRPLPMKAAAPQPPATVPTLFGE